MIRNGPLKISKSLKKAENGPFGKNLFPITVKAAVCNFNRPFWSEISLRIGHFQFLSANGQWPTPIWNTGHVVIGSSARDAGIFLNKQVKFKDLKNYASLNNKVCSNISWFMPVGMKLCQSKQADLLFSAFVRFSVHYSIPITNKVQYLKFRWGQKKMWVYFHMLKKIRVGWLAFLSPRNALLCAWFRPSVCGPCEHNRDYTVACFFVELVRHVNHDERMNPIDFGGQGHNGHIWR